MNHTAIAMPPVSGGYAQHQARVKALIRAGRHRQALAILLNLRGQVPLDVMLLTDMANCYWCLRDADAALQLVQVALDMAPQMAALWGKLGGMHLTLGQRSEAEQAFRRSLKLNPNSAPALANLNRVAPLDPKGSKVRRLGKLARDPKLPRAERAMAHNALARVAERAEKYPLAFNHFTHANTLSGGAYDQSQFDSLIDDLDARFRGPAAGPPPETEAPRVIFVCGMPRSGTTLVETILRRHADVDSVGESPLLQTVIGRYRTHLGQIATDHPATWLDHLTGAAAAELREAYLAGCRDRLAGASPPVIVDKMPLNVLELGFANAILPQARFVALSRHPLDVGLSNYCNNFGSRHPFSQSLEGIAHMTKTVWRALALYQARGLDVHLQSYRALTEHPEDQISTLLSALSLSWDPACLTPEAGGGMVQTASVTQVREPINRSGLDKWRPYEAELAPLTDALGSEAIAEWSAGDALC